MISWTGIRCRALIRGFWSCSAHPVRVTSAPLSRDRQRSVTLPARQRLAESMVEQIARLPAVPFDRRIGTSESKAQIPLQPRALLLKRHNQDAVIQLFRGSHMATPLNQFRPALSRYFIPARCHAIRFTATPSPRLPVLLFLPAYRSSFSRL